MTKRETRSRRVSRYWRANSEKSVCTSRRIQMARWRNRLGSTGDSGAGSAAVDRRAAFRQMSDDPGQQYISDGITEDITTELARFSGLSVASRLAAFHHGGKGKSPAEA